MQLHALTNGAISGTGFIELRGVVGTFGGAFINTDGSNACTIEIRLENSTGKIIWNPITTSAGWAVGPINIEGAERLYYSISGTGASAQLYEWQR